MDIEGVPKLFVALLHVLSRPEHWQAGKSEGLPFWNWSIDRQRIREIVGDSTYSTNTILSSLYACIEGSPSRLVPSSGNVVCIGLLHI